MDTFYAFLLFTALLVLENLASYRWLPAYFRIGLPVYIQRIPLPGLDETSVVSRLEAGFQSGETTAMRFRLIAPGQLALRENPFAQRSGPRYLPVMHSLLYLHGRQATIRGSLNWYVPAALAFAIYRSFQDQTFIPVNLILIVIFALSYLAQAAQLEKVKEVLTGR